MRHAVFALAALLLAACHFPEPKVGLAGPLPLDLTYREARGGLVILTGRVDDREDVDFILDTGAPVSVLLDGKRTTKLGLDTRLAVPLGNPNNPATPTGVLRGDTRIAFNGVTLLGLTVVVIPEKSMPCSERFDEIGFAGVIGADLFRKFVVEIDPVAKRVRLHDPAKWQPSPGASIVPIAFRDGHPFTMVKVRLPSGDTVSEDMNIDIGMNGSISLVAGSHPAIVMPKDGKPGNSCFVNGARSEMIGAPLDVTLGTKSFRVEAPRYTEYLNAVSDKRGGTLGVKLFQGERLTIDYPGKRIVVG
ncbi:hypothetical protein DSM104443_00568 [Usitatibacter rugosus]|uniref:Aspartyl protease n=1 Tax=Usitatibacter rugosus TaxID=2732067 RepID=A0A6M4GQA0_9PROT|nr:aspartyl protease family protein [Usitatibacter rugosus]QJR09519.1 hypothetical protein DSM104443_00568 [Usitatibacter rugosus]